MNSLVYHILHEVKLGPIFIWTDPSATSGFDHAKGGPHPNKTA